MNNQLFCVLDMKIHKQIADRFMEHLGWHLSLGFRMSPGDKEAFDPQEIWRDQVKNMHDVCQTLGESWAWEYLWKNW